MEFEKGQLLLAATYCIEVFHSRDLYTEVNHFEGVATQENSDLDSKRLFVLFLLSMALFCGHTSMQPFMTTKQRMSVRYL